MSNAVSNLNFIVERVEQKKSMKVAIKAARGLATLNYELSTIKRYSK